MLEKFFILDVPADPLIWQQHDPWLIALAVFLAIASSVIALLMADFARRARDPRTRQIALGSGSLALGGGFWGMHFVNMLAYSVCAQGRFDLGITALSVLPGLGASWVALHLLVKEKPAILDFIISGVLVGAGIGAMHYIGMEAAAMAPLMRYDPYWFAVSIVFAVLLAILALWVRFGLQRRWLQSHRHSTAAITLLAGCVMGLAIIGMHYFGIAALRFIAPPETLTVTDYSLPLQTSLSLAIAVVIMSLGMLAITANIGLRNRQLLIQTRLNESRQRAIFETAVDGIVTIDAKGLVQSFNSAAERMLGWQAEEVIGRNVNMLMPEPHHSAHDSYLSNYLTTGRTRIIGTGREVEALHKTGRLIPIRLAVGRIELPDTPMFVGFLTDLTARRDMELSLRRSEEQFRTLSANIPGVTFRCRFDNDWSMLYISDAVAELTGWSAADFLAGRIHFGQLQLAEEKPLIDHSVATALERNEDYHIEYRIRHRDGSIRWLTESARGVVDEQGKMQWIDGVMLDISEAKARNAEFEGTVAAIGRALAAVEYDLSGRVITANDNFLQLMDYSLDEIRGCHQRMFCTPEEIRSKAYAQRWLKLLKGEFETGEYLRIGKNGRQVWVQGSYNPIFDAEGQPFKIVEFSSDLSERHAMEQELRIAKNHAEQAAAARSNFLANMSHEIRTPMNAIIGFSENLLDSPLSNEQRRQLNTVHQSARSLLRLLNDILDTAKLEKGAVELESADFSLRELCQQILDSLQITASKKGLPLVLDYPSHLPEFFRGDSLRLQQVLVNLLGNAIKFTERGQVTLHVSYSAGKLQLDIADTGIGMSPAQLERIFDPFAQADASTTRRFGGTGLGTTISRQLVELMQGEIKVDSTPDVGTTFSVLLPLAVGQAPQKIQTRPGQQLPSLRVLAVDDVNENLDLLQILLTRDRHQITLASNGAEAVARCLETSFDLVLMDLQMPGMDGLEATRQIRANEHQQQRTAVPIIALSASVLAEDREAAQAAGMNGFADKPIDLPRLYGEIARVLQLEEDVSGTAATTAATTTSWAALDKAAPQTQIASGTAQVIDWQTGIQRWGDQEQLHRALTRFQSDNHDLADQLQTLQQAADWPALGALAHRLRGAAGNLSLPELQQALAALEDAMRTTAAMDVQAVNGLLDSLTRTWQAFVMALQSSPPPTQATPVADTVASALSRPQIDQALSHIDQAINVLARNEIPDTTLTSLTALLGSQAMADVQEALDSFAFRAAQDALQSLRAKLPTQSEENAP